MNHFIWYPGHELLLKDIVRAENCYLYDSTGRRYVDLESGVWCTSTGHGNPRILRVIAEQAAQISHTGFGYSSPVVEDTALEMLSLLGLEGGKCVFLCSGSEAVEYGVRVAQSIADRPLFMTMTDSYFGAYGSASLRREDEWFCFDWAECAACSLTGECDERCAHWRAIPFEEIGGFLFEPGSSSGLVRFPPERLIRSIVRTVRKSKGLLLVNEVTTGVGRTGAWFGYQHYGISPDIVAIGKGIGNGYPVSVSALSRVVVERLGSREIKYAQSHQNDPLGAAVAREVVRVIREEKLIERAVELGRVLGTGLEEIRVRTGLIKDVRARGLMVGLELVDDAEHSFTIRTHRELIRRGFVVGRRPGVNVLRLDPSLTVERGDIEAFLVALEDVLREQETK
ncbi:MAG: aspartate aminotransferase family protein [Candidatus Eiseniibacteriota bacterium]|nr:MAG: aspartate aminotransferase family protein [Candidatus Eisenbacteria bacterium]